MANTSQHPSSNYHQSYSYPYSHGQSAPMDSPASMGMGMANTHGDNGPNGSSTAAASGSDTQNGFTSISHPMQTLAGVSPINSGFGTVGVSGFPNGVAPPPLPPKRRPGRPPVYVFTKPDSELSENERRLKGAVLKRRMRQNRSYHRKKRLRQNQSQPNSQPQSPEPHPHQSHHQYEHPHDSVDSHNQYHPSNNTSSNNISIPPLALPALQPPQSHIRHSHNGPEESQHIHPPQHHQDQQAHQQNHQSQYNRPTLSSFSLSPSVPALVTPNRNHAHTYGHDHSPSRSHPQTSALNDQVHNASSATETGNNGNSNNAIATVLSHSGQNDSKTHEPISPTSFAPSSHTTTINSTSGSHSTSPSHGYSHPRSYSQSHSAVPSPNMHSSLGPNPHGNSTSPRTGDETRALQQLLDLSAPTTSNSTTNASGHTANNGTADVSSPMNTTSLINTNLDSYSHQHQHQHHQQQEQHAQTVPMSHHHDTQYSSPRTHIHGHQGQTMESQTPNQSHQAVSSPVNFEQADTQQGPPHSQAHTPVHSHPHQHQQHHTNYSVIPVQ